MGSGSLRCPSPPLRSPAPPGDGGSAPHAANGRAQQANIKLASLRLSFYLARKPLASRRALSAQPRQGQGRGTGTFGDHMREKVLGKLGGFPLFICFL